MAKIIVVCGYAKTLLNFRKELLEEMRKDHLVIACAPDGTPDLIAELENMGIEFRKIPLWRTGLNPWNDLKTIFSLKRLFMIEKPDIVFAYTSKPVIFGSIAAKLAKVPQMFSMITGLGSFFIYNDFKSSLIKQIMCILYRIGLRNNEKVFFQNEDDVNEFLRLNILSSKDKVKKVSGSGVNLERFQSSLKLHLPITFLLIARLIKDKGVCEYVAAARVIKKKYPNVRFQLAGWFEEKSSVIGKAELDSWVSEGTIEYLGELSDVRDALIQSSIYVLPSYREGVPRTVLEAMATGRAIITTNAPGCRDTVVAGKNGFLVPVKNVSALVQAMERFILEPNLAVEMGKYSREMAEEIFDVNKVNTNILQTMGLST